eukprot:211516_1
MKKLIGCSIVLFIFVALFVNLFLIDSTQFNYILPLALKTIQSQSNISLHSLISQSKLSINISHNVISTQTNQTISNNGEVIVIYNNKQSITDNIIKISTSLTLRLHKISPLFINISNDFSNQWITYPQWYQNDSIVVVLNRYLNTMTQIKNMFNTCWLSMDITNITNNQSVSYGTLTGCSSKHTFRKKQSFSNDPCRYICKFDKNTLATIHKYKYFGLYNNNFNHSKIIYFDIPERLTVNKHYLSVIVHDGIFGYPPQHVMKSFLEYYIFHGVTQFYLYHMRCDYYNTTNLITLFKTLYLYQKSKIEIEIWFFDIWLPMKVIKRYHNSYWTQFWVIQHSFLHSKYRSTWNICIDLDEYVISVFNDTIYDVCKSLDINSNWKAFQMNRYQFYEDICLMVNYSYNYDTKLDNSYDNKQLIVFRDRKKISTGKILYRTDVDVIRLGIHKIKVKDRKHLATMNGDKYFYVSHKQVLKTIKGFKTCEYIVSLDNLMTSIVYNNKTINTVTQCIDQRMYNYMYLLEDVSMPWKC